MSVVLGIIVPLLVYNELSDPTSSTYDKVHSCLMAIIFPYIIWTAYFLGYRLREIVISDNGIHILPYGFHIRPNEIKRIRYVEKYRGAKYLEIKLHKSRWLLHISALSFGRTMTINLNTRFMTWLASPAP